MAQISNRILISSVNDGTTIHGSLRATKSLTQGWNGSTAIPDWTAQGTAYYHPTVYLTLFNGQEQIQPTSFSWYYNGTLLEFNSSGYSTNTGMANWFLRYNDDPDGSGQGIGATECLEICTNLASSSNVDIDLIRIAGTVEMGGAPVDFEAGIDVTISKVESDGYLGLLNFVSGKCTLNGDGDYVSVKADLQKAGGSVQGFGVAWEINGTSIAGSTANNIQFYTAGDFRTASATPTPYIRIYGRYVTDIATLVCKFYNPATVTEANLMTSAMVVIDDVGDPEYLFIRYTVSQGAQTINNGAPVSLHSGQSVTYKMWVARSDNSNAPYAVSAMEAQPHNASGALMTASGFSVAPLSTSGKYSGGWCDIKTSVTTDDGSTSATGGVLTVAYGDVTAAGGNVSIIVRATLA